MDFIEINKLTQKSKVDTSRNNMYYRRNINVDDSVILITYACKKMYGLSNTAKILHGLGIEKIKSQL